MGVDEERWEREERRREGATDMCLGRQRKQTLNDMVGALKRAARERLFSLQRHDLIATGARAENGAEPKQ